MKKENKRFKNIIDETLYVMEELKKCGADVAFIPQSINGKTTKLGDVEIPDIEEFCKTVNFDIDYPIGSRMKTIKDEYRGNKHDYCFKESERNRTENLGFLNSTNQNIIETLNYLEILKENGIDLSTAKKSIVDKNGKERKRYICEIKDEKINEVITEYGIPKYLLIGKRIKQIKKAIIENEKYKQGEIASRFKKLNVIDNRNVLSISKILKVFDELDKIGINSKSLNMWRIKNKQFLRIKDLPISDMEGFTRGLNIDETFEIGKGIQKISMSYLKGTYLKDTKISNEEKIKLEKYMELRKKEIIRKKQISRNKKINNGSDHGER